MQLPSRVEGVIEQQIGRLDDELRGVLRVASVMGETFTLEVVASVLRADKRSVEARINRDLERRHQLVNAHGIQRIGNLRVSQYRFRHSLFQTYLYNELNANERSNLHGEVALALEDLYGERSEDVAVQLARHFDIAGDDAPAARYLKLAGDDALRVYAYAEARAYYQSALDALGRLPDNEASRTQRVAATVALVRSAYVSDPPPTNMERLQEIEPVAAGLAEPSGGGGGDVQPLAWVHYWMGRLGFMMNEPAKAIGYYQQVQAVADQLEDPELLANPASMIGRAFVSQGRLAEAEPLLRQAVGPLEAQGNIAEWIMTTGYLGMSIAGRGAYEEALATAARGLARARQVDSPMGIGLSHVYQWYIHFLGGRVDRMRESAAAAVATAREAGDLMIEYVGLGMHAWAASRAGRPHEAERLMDECQRLGKSLGDRLVVADWFAAARVDIELALGRPEEACRRAEQAVELAKRMGGVYAEGFAERAWAQALAVTNESGPGAVDGHFAASLKAFQAGEILPEVARSRVAWAEALNRRGDRDAAEEQLRAAEALLEEIGLDTELGEVRTLLSGAT
jgi:tetratricopeptide (TPR) repeat protein